MKIALISTGSELLRGDIVDTNASWIARLLSDSGYTTHEIAACPDDSSRLKSTLSRLAHEHDVVIQTGGLGPTTDDLTAQCVAEVIGVELRRDESELAKLAQRYASRGRTLSEYSKKQVDFPEGAAVLPNPHGTAAGFTVRIHQALCFFLPGVPQEMRQMMLHEVLPRLPKPAMTLHVRRLQTYGLGEGEINDRLMDLSDLPRLTLGYRAAHAAVEIKLMLESTHAAEPQAELDQLAAEVRRRLGEHIVYGEGDVTFEQALGALLAERGLSFGVAESCTGGLVASRMTRAPGASRYFWGGICSYDNSVKCHLLGVGADVLSDHGAVSEVVARQMAEGARRALGVDIALSLTGVAGPSGGTAEKPVGLVHWAVATPHRTTAFVARFQGDRGEIQERAARRGLASVREVLLEDSSLRRL